MSDAAALEALLRTGTIDLDDGRLGFSPAGAIAVADAATAGGTIDVVLVEDPAAWAASVFAGRDALFADRGNDWIPDATTLLRIKIPGGVRAPVPPGAPFDVSGDQPSVAGRSPPGVVGPLISAERDYDTGEPHVDVACLTSVPGRLAGSLHGIVRVARTPGENMIETRDQTFLPTDVRFDVPLVAASAVAPPPSTDHGFELMARVPVPDTIYGTDVWGGRDVAYLGARASGDDAVTGVGLYVVDLTDVRAPVATAVDGVGPALDVVARGTTVYVASASQDHGLFEVDARNPRAPRVVRAIDTAHVQPSLHDLYPEGDRLYASCLGSCEDDGLAVLALGDPDGDSLPVEAAYFGSTALGGGDSGSVHDTTTVGGIAGVANWTGGWQVWDLRDLTHPRMRASFTHTAVQAHSIVLWGDGERFAATADEYAGGHVRLWDLQAPGGPLEVASYQSRRAVSAHNLWIQGTTLYVSYYQDGLRALDVSDPTHPREVGSFATYKPRSSTPKSGYLAIFAGDWGVWADGDRVLVSDTEAGLFVLRRTF